MSVEGKPHGWAGRTLYTDGKLPTGNRNEPPRDAFMNMDMEIPQAQAVERASE
jgi:hypothetical protein